MTLRGPFLLLLEEPFYDPQVFPAHHGKRDYNDQPLGDLNTPQQLLHLRYQQHQLLLCQHLRD